MLDEDLNQKIQSLNNKQSQIFDMMTFINRLDSYRICKVPIFLCIFFITGKGGCGKSHLYIAYTENNIFFPD